MAVEPGGAWVAGVGGWGRRGSGTSRRSEAGIGRGPGAEEAGGQGGSGWRERKCQRGWCSGGSLVAPWWLGGGRLEKNTGGAGGRWGSGLQEAAGAKRDRGAERRGERRALRVAVGEQAAIDAEHSRGVERRGGGGGCNGGRVGRSTSGRGRRLGPMGVGDWQEAGGRRW
ncbi:uncharacterized protein LOC131061643 [Cryptomeria japonica]|uniref:uncharacterized protein LOC131061643 n=1 Tax=Cryptomeria japonica TaxID=3369 RepID=UPI0027DAB35A|nr:uncharacterized protein LOC131061643 [Cryptomeria japonica]